MHPSMILISFSLFSFPILGWIVIWKLSLSRLRFFREIFAGIFSNDSDIKKAKSSSLPHSNLKDNLKDNLKEKSKFEKQL